MSVQLVLGIFRKTAMCKKKRGTSTLSRNNFLENNYYSFILAIYTIIPHSFIIHKGTSLALNGDIGTSHFVLYKLRL